MRYFVQICDSANRWLDAPNMSAFTHAQEAIYAMIERANLERNFRLPYRVVGRLENPTYIVAQYTRLEA